MTSCEVWFVYSDGGESILGIFTFKERAIKAMGGDADVWQLTRVILDKYYDDRNYPMEGE